MDDDSNYYQIDPRATKGSDSERFPKNHVTFPHFKKHHEWINRIFSWFGYQPLNMTADILKEFDSADPLDKYLGTDFELKEIRRIVQTHCECVDNNPYLSPAGRSLHKTISLMAVSARKKTLQFYHDNKTFIDDNGAIKAPVIITGLPRSGSTLLYRLMSEDSNTRTPYTFEMDLPAPPMKNDMDPLKDPRIESTGIGIDALSRLAPGFIEKFAESHFMGPAEKEETFIAMLAHNGLFVMNYATAGKEYIEALFKAEGKGPVFKYERLFFTMLDAYRPAKSHWTFKAPHYSPFFPSIFEEYPDAKVIVTHRNLFSILPSICRLFESWCIAFDVDGSFDKHRFGKLLNKTLGSHFMVPMRYRQEHPEKEGQIFDCIYEEFILDPIAMVKKIYNEFGLEYSEEFEQRMKVYLENNRQGKHGRHKYSLEEYGYSTDTISEEYSEYLKEYQYSPQA